jgi:formylglycine-generating enzyme
MVKRDQSCSCFFLCCLLAAGAGAAVERHLEYVPAGGLQQGETVADEVGEGFADECPVHVVPVSAFYIENLEVTKALWDVVREWAVTNGYVDLPAGQAGSATNGPAGSNHPVARVSWHDAARWCNARSEREYLVPAYYTNDAHSVAYRSGTNVPDALRVKADATGYRLPTESQWEWAARGALPETYYPWGGAGGWHADHIATTQAQYAAQGTAPAGSYAPNGYLLYDMAGNAAEWCWDWFDDMYYATHATGAWPADPAGPERAPPASLKVSRGGSWAAPASDLRCSFRDSDPPGTARDTQGFRVAMAFEGAPHPDRDGDGLPDWWEYDFFGSKTNAVPGDDPDGDSLDNGTECGLGSDPFDARSGFALGLLVGDSSGLVTWPSASGHTYRVEFATNLMSPDAFALLTNGLEATPPLNTYTDATMRALSPVYYRVWVLGGGQ